MICRAMVGSWDDHFVLDGIGGDDFAGRMHLL